ncbi:hypothetical protein AUP68_07057 [Ilyonectria robusta]
MPSSNQILSALAAVAITSANAAMGPAFSTGPVADNSFIRESTSTLVLPNVPSGGSTDGITSLWVGMGTSNGDLIQSIADNWQSSSWEIYAYTLLKTGDNSQMPVQGPSGAAGEGDKITMHCKYKHPSLWERGTKAHCKLQTSSMTPLVTTLRPSRSTATLFPLSLPATVMLRVGVPPLSAQRITAAPSAPTVSLSLFVYVAIGTNGD